MTPEQYAKVVDGVIVVAPGPLPYYDRLPNGDPVQLRGANADLAALGWKLVEQRGWREIDEEIEQALTPTVTLEAGKVVQTWSYGFVPAARSNMLRKIDEQAEAARANYIGAYPGQTMEYAEAYEQAKAVKALNAGATITPGQFPFLDADIAVTSVPGQGR